MIVRSAFRAPGDLGDHLQHYDTNERVILREDLSKGCELDIQAALDDFAAFGADIANEKSLVHFVVSPSLKLTDDQEKRMFDVIREAYSISASQPMLVIEHVKPGETGRPSHFHIIFPRRNIATGHLIRDSYYKTKNDRLAVQLDAEFEAAKIVPIVHAKSVELWLSSNDPATLTMIKAAGGLKTPAQRPPDTPTAPEKRRAADAGIDLADFAKRTLDTYDGAKGSPTEANWFTAGLRLARGDKNIMVVDLATGFCGPLYRNFNAAAKRQGNARRWRDTELSELLHNGAPAMSAAVAASKWADPKAKRRGRKPSATQEEITVEAARRREIEADITKIKAKATVAPQKARDLRRQIERISVCGTSLLTTAKDFALTSVIGCPAAAAALATAVLINIILRGRQRRMLAERGKKAVAAADVRRRLDEYFIEVRRRRQSPMSQIVAPTTAKPPSPRPASLPDEALLPDALARLSPVDAAFVFLTAVAALDRFGEQTKRSHSADAQFDALAAIAPSATDAAFAALASPIESQEQEDDLHAVLSYFKKNHPANSDIWRVARAAGGEVTRVVAAEMLKQRAHERA